MIDQLDKLITLTERTNNDSLKGYICSSYYKCGDKPYLIYKFLYDSEQHYPTEKIQLLKDIKIRIRKFFESVCISKEKDPNQIRYLLRFTPVFFSEPEDAIKYIKPYMQEQKLYGDVLVSINFDNIPAWKRKKGGKVWLDFLNSFKKRPEKYYQFYALKSLFTHSVKGLTNPPQNPKCLIEYLDWLSIPENVSWLAENYEGVRNDLTNTFLMPIECSENLPIEQRLNLASKFIIPLWRKSKHFDDRTFNNHFWTILRFLNKEYIKCRKENITKFNNTLKKELNIALETIDNRYPKAKKEHRDILRKFALIELFPEFQKKRIIHDNPPEIKGAQIIYDYADDSPDWKTEKNDDFYGFCSVFGVERIALLCEKNIIWLVYGIKEGVRVIRIDLLDKKSQTTIDVKIERLYTTDDIQLCRFKDFLGISYASKITMIPVISKKPYLDTDSKRVKILGREITPNVTLGMSFHDNQDQQVLTMIPGEKSLYLCTKKQWNRKISLSGIYRWQEGMDKCEEVRSATSLKIGMFNDCSPHSVFGGSKVDNGNLILFVKFHPENEAQGKISGIWQYNLGLDKFSLIQKDNFHNLAHYFANQNKSPKRFSASHFYYLVDIGTCYMVNKKTGKLRMLANPFEYIRDFDNFFPYNEKQDLLGVNRLLVENEWGKELLKYDTSLKKEICLFKPEDREFFLHTTVLSNYGPVLLFVQSVPDPTLKSPDKMVERRLILYHMPNRKEPTISQRKTIHNNEDNK